MWTAEDAPAIVGDGRMGVHAQATSRCGRRVGLLGIGWFVPFIVGVAVLQGELLARGCPVAQVRDFSTPPGGGLGRRLRRGLRVHAVSAFLPSVRRCCHGLVHQISARSPGVAAARGGRKWRL